METGPANAGVSGGKLQLPTGPIITLKIPAKTNPSISQAEYYVLELSVAPGGSRKHDLYLLRSLTEVHRILQRDLIDDAGLAIWYGERILLHRCVNENVVETIDLHPFITFHVGQFAPIRFSSEDDIMGYHQSKLFDAEYKDYTDPSPIDFTSTDINEVYRYLHYDTMERFRIMRQRGQIGSDMESYPPNVGVQIDLPSIQRIENPIQYFRAETTVTIRDEEYELIPGENHLDT